MWLTPTQAHWLGHLYHASCRAQSLSAYAREQRLSLAELLGWERQLLTAGVALPRRHRPARFVAVEVTG